MTIPRDVIAETYHQCLLNGDHRVSDLADAILSALAAAGIKCVGREPTEAMLSAMRDAWDYFDAGDDVFSREWRGAWDAASPTTPPKG